MDPSNFNEANGKEGNRRGDLIKYEHAVAEALVMGWGRDCSCLAETKMMHENQRKIEASETWSSTKIIACQWHAHLHDEDVRSLPVIL